MGIAEGAHAQVIARLPMVRQRAAACLSRGRVSVATVKAPLQVIARLPSLLATEYIALLVNLTP